MRSNEHVSLAEKILRQHNIESVKRLLLITLKRFTMKTVQVEPNQTKQQTNCTVLGGESTRELDVIAKTCGNWKAVIVKEMSALNCEEKRGTLR